MLTSIRRFQKAVLIVVTAIICVAFAWLYNRYDSTSGGPASSMMVDGQPYRIENALRLANLFNVARFDLGAGASFFQPSPLGEFAAALSGNSMSDRTQFVANLIVLRNEAKRLGIEASPKEVEKVLAQLPKFQNPTTRQFDPKFYQNYLKNELGRYSMEEVDLYELLGDYVKFRKLRDLVAAGHKPTTWEIDQLYELQYETFTAHHVTLKREDFAKDVEISDEAVKAYYEENRDSLFSEPKRSVGYVKFLKEEKKDEETEEEFEKRRNEQAKQFNDTLREIAAKMDDEGLTFEAAIATLGDRVKTAEPFARSEPPEELKDQPELIREIFATDSSLEGADKVRAADEEKAIYMFWIDRVLEREQLTLEEAKAQIAETLREQEINQRLQDAGEEALAKIRANLTEGTDFTAAAKAAGFEAVSPKPFARTGTPEGTDYATTLSRTATELEAGEFAEPELLDDALLLVYLESRELPQRKTEPEDRQQLTNQISSFLSTQMFNAWFESRVRAANPRPPLVQGADGKLTPMSLEEFARR